MSNTLATHSQHISNLLELFFRKEAVAVDVPLFEQLNEHAVAAHHILELYQRNLVDQGL